MTSSQRFRLLLSFAEQRHITNVRSLLQLYEMEHNVCIRLGRETCLVSHASRHTYRSRRLSSAALVRLCIQDVTRVPRLFLQTFASAKNTIDWDLTEPCLKARG